MVKRQIFIDTETTGLSARGGHRIVELAAVEAVNGKLTRKTFHTYLNPGRAIDPYAQKVHGLSLEFLANKPRFSDIAKDFTSFVHGAECLMHNAPFDTGFINAELDAAGYSQHLQQLANIVCTVNLAKSRFPGESVSLDSLIELSGNSTSRKNHSALEDANLLAHVYFNLLAKPTAESISISQTPSNQKSMVPTPQQLGLTKTLAFINVPIGQTFFYKKRVNEVCGGNIQIIETAHEDIHRFRRTSGPFIYAVADSGGNTRYLGKSLEAFLYKRWIRIKGNIHHKECRDHIISDILANGSPVWLWSASIDELRNKLPFEVRSLDSRVIAKKLEALWIQRWKPQLWNGKLETVDPSFSDGEYWLS